MAESRAVVRHLLRGAEELLRAASEGLAVVRERSEAAAGAEHAAPAEDPEPPGSARATPEGSAGSLEDVARRLADDLAHWLAGGESRAVDELRATLRNETRRWDLRAGEDPAARRVHDLFALLLEMLGDEHPERRRPAEPAHGDSGTEERGTEERGDEEPGPSAPGRAHAPRTGERWRPPRRAFTPRPGERK